MTKAETKIHSLVHLPPWYATQEGRSVAIYNRDSRELLTTLEPPKEWGDNWAWNFTPDGDGVVFDGFVHSH